MSLDSDGYPTQESLDAIKDWDYVKGIWNDQGQKDYHGFIEFIKLWNETWWTPSWGWSFTKRRLYVSTGGWSGNEETIEYVMDNHLFWSQHWVSTRRGGHFIFELPEKVIREAKKVCVYSGGERSG